MLFRDFVFELFVVRVNKLLLSMSALHFVFLDGQEHVNSFVGKFVAKCVAIQKREKR
jgi:hypothetical protein